MTNLYVGLIIYSVSTYAMTLLKDMEEGYWSNVWKMQVFF